MKFNLLVFILILITSITLTKSQSNRVREDSGKECDAESECLLSTECEYYQDQQDVLKSLSKGKTRNALIRKLRNTICNVGKRAVCCPKPSLNDSNCGWPKRVPSNVRFVPTNMEKFRKNTINLYDSKTKIFLDRLFVLKQIVPQILENFHFLL